MQRFDARLVVLWLTVLVNKWATKVRVRNGVLSNSVVLDFYPAVGILHFTAVKRTALLGHTAWHLRFLFRVE